MGFWIALCLVPIPGALGQMGPRITVEGRVRTNQGQTVPGGATVVLRTGEGMEVGQQFTTSDGEFSFSDIRKAVYTLTVTAKGFQTYQTTLDLTTTGDPYELNVYLVPARHAVPTPAGVLSRSDLEAPQKARSENRKGEQALTRRKLADARRHFEKALAIDPCYARAQSNLAVVREQQHDMNGAIALLRKSLQCDPGFPDSYIELAELLNAQGKFSESQAILKEGVRRAPSAWQFYYQLGLADFGQGKYAQAETNWLKVKYFNSSPPPELYVKLADLYVKERAFPKAYGAMQAYLRAAPKGRYAGRVKSIMRQMEAAGVVGKSQVTGGKANPVH